MNHSRRLGILGLEIGVSLLLGAFGVPRAVAQSGTSCGADLFRGPRLVAPAVGASGVTLDAPIQVQFNPSNYFDDAAIGADPNHILTLVNQTTMEEVTGRAMVLDGRHFVFVPDEHLPAQTSFSGVVSGVDGDLEVRFTTGSSVDLGPPLLRAIESVESREEDPNCDAPEGGFRIDVTFAPADDDGPAGSVEYILFLSRGSQVEQPKQVAGTRNFSTEHLTMSFVLTAEEASTPACVVVHAVDGVGNVDDNGSGICFDPVTGAFFQGLCSASGFPGNRALGGNLALMAMAVVLVLVRRRR